MAGFNHFARIGAQLYEDLKNIVEVVADQIAQDAQDLAPVDTGFLRDSIYVAKFGSSTYAAAGYVSSTGVYLLDEVATPANEFTAYVAVGAPYAVYVEDGTRFMRAQPFFEPAIQWGLDLLQVEVDALLR
jgi:HK97 gp10 family phage protein